jgi:carboxyl-terminal processing protease
MSRNLKYILSFVLWVVITLLSVVIFWQIKESEFEKQNVNLDISKIIQNFSSKINVSGNWKYRRFDQLYDILQKWYRSGDQINSGDMMQSAMKSYVDAIWDPFTTYMDVQENEDLKQALQWSEDFEWIWAYISKKDNGIRIEEIINNSPAYKAGLQTFDTIIQVDGKSVIDLSIWEWVKLIKWPAWTKVELTIIRKNKNGEWKLIKKEVVRDVVKIFSVKWELFSWNIWYIKISSVGTETADLFFKEAMLLKSQWMNKLILDLRWNGWWILEWAVDILSYFVPKWEIVVSSKYRSLYEDKDYESVWYWLLEDMSISVLVDWLTASAWEIIAMALVELNDANLIWTRTFGKWSIQIMHPFADSSSLKYTVWKRYSPNWENIHGTWYFVWDELLFDRTWYLETDVDNQLEFAKDSFDN